MQGGTSWYQHRSMSPWLPRVESRGSSTMRCFGPGEKVRIYRPQHVGISGPSSLPMERADWRHRNLRRDVGRPTLDVVPWPLYYI